MVVLIARRMQAGMQKLGLIVLSDIERLIFRVEVDRGETIWTRPVQTHIAKNRALSLSAGDCLSISDLMAGRVHRLVLLAAHDLHLLEDLVATITRQPARQLVVMQKHLLLDLLFLANHALLTVISLPATLLQSKEKARLADRD